tara:strand:- start:23313 stop:23834 length:522 start_codon:yes stop_codon:yes gene_type:complete
MSLKDDILNTIDDPKAFTNQVSNLVHMPTSVVKSLTEPLGLRDYMNLAKAVDEEDPESAKQILQSGFDRLDDDTKTLLDEYSVADAFKQGYKSKTVSKNTASAGNIQGNTSTEPKSTQGTQGTQGTKQASKDQAQDMMKNVDKEISGSIKKLQNDPEFAKIIKFADIVAKNKK